MNKYLSLFLLFLTFNLSAQNKTFIVVDKNGNGDFTTVAESINSLPMFVYERTIIFIKNGIYEERIRIEQDNITLLGENRDSTIIQYNLLREDWNNNKDDIGPGVVNIFGDDIIIENLTVENTQPQIGPHAFAIYGMGTRIILSRGNFISKGGDTVSLWDYKNGMYYHNDCYFEGAVDFVCPRGWCYIKNSKFYEHKKTASVWHAGGFDKTQKFVIVNSEFDGVKGFKLGRHHYESQFYFIGCTFSSNLADEPIYRVTYEDTTRNRPFNWGARYYFYSSQKAGEQFDWLSNNIDSSPEIESVDQVTPEWTFNYQWNPESLIPTKLKK